MDKDHEVLIYLGLRGPFGALFYIHLYRLFLERSKY
jgi:hypothetical protein